MCGCRPVLYIPYPKYPDTCKKVIYYAHDLLVGRKSVQIYIDTHVHILMIYIVTVSKLKPLLYHLIACTMILHRWNEFYRRLIPHVSYSSQRHIQTHRYLRTEYNVFSILMKWWSEKNAIVKLASFLAIGCFGVKYPWRILNASLNEYYLINLHFQNNSSSTTIH